MVEQWPNGSLTMKVVQQVVLLLGQGPERVNGTLAALADQLAAEAGLGPGRVLASLSPHTTISSPALGSGSGQGGEGAGGGGGDAKSGDWYCVVRVSAWVAGPTRPSELSPSPDDVLSEDRVTKAMRVVKLNPPVARAASEAGLPPPPARPSPPQPPPGGGPGQGSTHNRSGSHVVAADGGWGLDSDGPDAPVAIRDALAVGLVVLVALGLVMAAAYMIHTRLTRTAQMAHAHMLPDLPSPTGGAPAVFSSVRWPGESCGNGRGRGITASMSPLQPSSSRLSLSLGKAQRLPPPSVSEQRALVSAADPDDDA